MQSVSKNRSMAGREKMALVAGGASGVPHVGLLSQTTRKVGSIRIVCPGGGVVNCRRRQSLSCENTCLVNTSMYIFVEHTHTHTGADARLCHRTRVGH